VGWFSGSDDQKQKSPVTTINGKPVTDPAFAVKPTTPTVVPATPPPLPSTSAVAATAVSTAQDAAIKQRKRAVAGDTLINPATSPSTAPAPRYAPQTLVGGR
jgi:hypothetical protein